MYCTVRNFDTNAFYCHHSFIPPLFGCVECGHKDHDMSHTNICFSLLLPKNLMLTDQWFVNFWPSKISNC